MDEVEFLAFALGDIRINTSFLQISEQCRMRKLPDFQLLETRFGWLLTKRERCGTDMRCLSCYLAKQGGHIIILIEFPCQREDIAAFAQPEIEPLVQSGIDLE